MCSKADVSQLNLAHGTNNYKVENRKTRKEKNQICSSVSKQSGDSMQSVLKKNREATVGRICRKGMKAMEWWTTNNKWCIAGSIPCSLHPLHDGARRHKGHKATNCTSD